MLFPFFQTPATFQNIFMYVKIKYEQDQKSLDAVEGKTNKTDNTEKNLNDLTWLT